MAEMCKMEYTEGKDVWTVKQDSNNLKWVLYKNKKKIKTSQDWNKIAVEIPCYQKG